MALYIDSAVLDDITEVTKTISGLVRNGDRSQSEQAIEKFAQDWQKMKTL